MVDTDRGLELSIHRFLEVAWLRHRAVRYVSILATVLIVALTVPGPWWMMCLAGATLGVLADALNAMRFTRLADSLDSLTQTEKQRFLTQNIHITAICTAIYMVPFLLISFAPSPGPLIGLFYCSGAALVSASQHVVTPRMAFQNFPLILLGFGLNGFALGDGDTAYFTAFLAVALGLNGLVLAMAGAKTFGDLISARVQAESTSTILEQRVHERTRELEEEKLKLEQSLQTEKAANELQSQFVATASHEFRTPLTIIDGAARRIDKAQDRNTYDAIPRHVETIRNSVTRMTILIDRTLDASKLTSGKIKLAPAEYDLAQQVCDITGRMREIAPAHTITLDIDTGPAIFMGDVRLMESVLTNVISNSVKYSKDNPSVQVSLRQENGHYVFSSRDNGIGIPKADLEQISERFFRASNTEGIQGTGIGLNLTKMLVEQHGGRLAIDSEEGAWTKVTVYLPIFDANSEESTLPISRLAS